MRRLLTPMLLAVVLAGVPPDAQRRTPRKLRAKPRAESRAGPAEDDDAGREMPVAHRHGDQDRPELLRRPAGPRARPGHRHHAAAAHRPGHADLRSACPARVFGRRDEARQGLRALPRRDRRADDEGRPAGSGRRRRGVPHGGRPVRSHRRRRRSGQPESGRARPAANRSSSPCRRASTRSACSAKRSTRSRRPATKPSSCRDARSRSSATCCSNTALRRARR